MTTTDGSITAERFATLPDRGRPRELVRGRILEMNPPGPRHGQICGAVYRIVGTYTHQHQLGHVLTNDSGVITERNPDTVRGADVALYLHSKVPPGPLPNEYLPVAPDLVFEILSPTDRRGEVLAKVAEYLKAGVSVVCILDDQSKSASVFFAGHSIENLTGDDELALPEILGDFRIPVRHFFE